MRRTNQIQILLGLLGLVGVVLIVVSTSRYGVGMTTISGDIISAAKNLAAFEGYLQHDGRPYVEYPPLLPTILAVISATGIDPVDAIRYLNAICFGFIIFISGRWLQKNITLQPLTLLGAVSFALSFPVILVSIYAWAETVFALLIILFLFELEKYLENGKTSSFYLAIVYAALCCLTRYIGVLAILTGAVLLFLGREGTLRSKLRRAVVFGLLAILPTVAWIVRNYLITSQLSGERGIADVTFSHNVYQTAKILSGWFIPPRITDTPRIIIAGLMFAGLCVWLVRIIVRSRGDRTDSTKARKVLPIAVFTLAYTVILVVVASVVALDALNSRFFAPIYIPAFLLVFFTIDDLRKAAARFVSVKLVNYLIVGAFLLWLVFPLRGVARNVQWFAHNGAGGYSTTEWRRSELINYLNTHSLDGEVYSNEPYAAHILSGVPAKLSPRKHLFRAPETRTEDLAHFKEAIKTNGNFYLVWFDEIERPYLYSIDELQESFTLEIADSLSDGSVYMIK